MDTVQMKSEKRTAKFPLYPLAAIVRECKEKRTEANWLDGSALGKALATELEVISGLSNDLETAAQEAELR